MSKSKNLNIRVTQEEHTSFKKLADKKGIKLSELVRHLLKEYKGGNE